MSYRKSTKSKRRDLVKLTFGEDSKSHALLRL